MVALMRACFLRITAVIFFVLAGCSPEERPYTERPLADIYLSAYKDLREGKYGDAAYNFDQVDQQYPYSAWAPQSQLMSAYASYQNKNYERAIGTLDNFISFYLYHEASPYAYYLRAMCYYAQIGSVVHDLKVMRSAYDAFSVLIERFPETPYARDARLKKVIVYNRLAAHDLVIGRFYLKQQNWIAALDRFQNVVNTYPESDSAPEALYRIVECSIALGIRDEAIRTVAALKQKFPKSTWTYDAGHLLNSYRLSTPKVNHPAGKV
jgi:outer membrane protein assembly factor BamD